jgi:HAE1 family hydrophobic/amphiphilic exporter-1
MAVTIIGGLVTSTVLTLGIVPVVYSIIDGIRNRFFKPAVDSDVPEAPTSSHPHVVNE